MKVNISVDDELMDRIDSYAKKNYLSRSGFISLACTQYLNTADVITAIQEISFSIRKIADTNVIDEEMQNKLKDFELFAKMFIEKK